MYIKKTGRMRAEYRKCPDKSCKDRKGSKPHKVCSDLLQKQPNQDV